MFQKSTSLPVLVALLLSLTGRLHAADSAIAVAWNDTTTGMGMVGAIRASAPWDYVRQPIEVGANSILQSAFGKLYALSPVDDTVRVIDPVTWSVERTYSLDAGDEPVDIEVVSPERAYVTRSNAAGLLQLDLTSGALHESVDLGVLADPDGIPDQATMAVHEGRLFVQLQRLNFDNDPPFPKPFIAVVDLASGELIDTDLGQDGVQAIELAGTFPKTRMQVVESTQKLIVSATGAFFDEGGIEVVDLENLRSDGLAIREADGFTGADLGPFVMVGADRGFLAYSTDLLLSSHLHQFSLSGEVDSAELAVALDYFSPAIEFDPATNSVFFPIGGSIDTGLHVFDATTGAQLNERLIATSGNPTDLIRLAAIPEPTLTLHLAAAGALLAARGRRSRRHDAVARLSPHRAGASFF